MELNNLTNWLFKQSIIVFLVKNIGVLTSFLLHIYMARQLGPEQFGIYSYVISWVLILALFSSFGFEHLQAKYVAKFKVKGQLYELATLTQSASQFVISLGVLVAIIASISIYMFRDTISDEISTAFLWGVLIIPFLAIINSNKGVLRGLKKQIHISILTDFLRPFMILLFFYIFVQSRQETSASIMIQITLSVLFFIFLLSIHAVKININCGDSMLNEIKKRTIKEKFYTTVNWSTTAIPFVLYVGVIQVEKNIDILMLGLLNDMKTAGIFAIVSKITTMLILLTTTINLVASPIFSELFSLSKIEELGNIVTTIRIISSTVASLFLLMIYFYGKEIILIFGSEYIEGLIALKILVAAQFCRTLMGPVLMISVMTGLQKVAVKVIGVGVLIHLILNSILIPHWGVLGAAISSLISTVFWSFLLSYMIYKRIGIRTAICFKR